VQACSWLIPATARQREASSNADSITVAVHSKPPFLGWLCRVFLCLDVNKSRLRRGGIRCDTVETIRFTGCRCIMQKRNLRQSWQTADSGELQTVVH